MKIARHNLAPDRRNERGSAVLLILALLAILLILFSVNLATVRVLRKDLSLVEKRQLRRLERHQPEREKEKTADRASP